MGWEQDQAILQNQAKAQASLDYLVKQFTTFTQLATILTENVPALAKAMDVLGDAMGHLRDEEKACCKQTQALLSKILEVLIPPPAVRFTAATILNNPTEGENIMMAKAGSLKATADLQVADNGTFTVALTFEDADGVPTVVPAGLSASYTASDATPGPSALTLTPSADTSSCAGSINQTTIAALVAAAQAAGTTVVLPTGLTVSVTATWNGLASPLTVVAAPPVDVVAGTANTFVAADTTP